MTAQGEKKYPIQGEISCRFSKSSLCPCNVFHVVKNNGATQEIDCSDIVIKNEEFFLNILAPIFWQRYQAANESSDWVLV